MMISVAELVSASLLSISTPQTHGNISVDAASLITLVNVTALVTIMLSMGLQVKWQAVMASTRPVLLVVLGLFANYVLVPAVTLGLLHLFQADPMVSAGFFILAVCPGAPIGPPVTGIAKGNVPWAIGIMVILAGLSVFLSPALLSVLLAWTAPDSDLRIDYVAILRTLLVAQMFPLTMGLGIHHWAPKLTQWIVKPLGMLANALLLVLVGLIVATQYETLAAIRLRGWTGMSLLSLATLGLGWFCGGSDIAIRKALAVTTAARNAAVGLVIVTSNFAGTPAVTAVVAYALVSILGTLGFGVLVSKVGADETKKASSS
jgi:BASS family bile acid:Na+ symporter